MDILLNGTALSKLYCDRAFKHLILMGNLSNYDNEFAADGRRLHYFFFQVDSGIEPNLTLLNKPDLLLTGLTYQNTRPLGTGVLETVSGKKCLEMNFLVELTKIKEVTFYLTGTIDRIDTDGYVTRIIDHKTTRSQNTLRTGERYLSSIQLPLYLYVTRNVLREYIKDIKETIVGYYHIVNIVTGKSRLSPRIEGDDKLVEALLLNSAQRAYELLHRDIKDIVPNGKFYNACATCVLNSICSSSSAMELLSEQSAEPYDPRKWHEEET